MDDTGPPPHTTFPFRPADRFATPLSVLRGLVPFGSNGGVRTVLVPALRGGPGWGRASPWTSAKVDFITSVTARQLSFHLGLLSFDGFSGWSRPRRALPDGAGGGGGGGGDGGGGSSLGTVARTGPGRVGDPLDAGGHVVSRGPPAFTQFLPLRCPGSFHKDPPSPSFSLPPFRPSLLISAPRPLCSRRGSSSHARRKGLERRVARPRFSAIGTFRAFAVPAMSRAEGQTGAGGRRARGGEGGSTGGRPRARGRGGGESGAGGVRPFVLCAPGFLTAVHPLRHDPLPLRGYVRSGPGGLATEVADLYATPGPDEGLSLTPSRHWVCGRFIGRRRSEGPRGLSLGQTEGDRYIEGRVDFSDQVLSVLGLYDRSVF